MNIGIDHGYYAIKPRHFSFPAGIAEYSHEPYTLQNTLEFGGKFYVCGTGRQPILRNKMENDNYYLLTLAAIAKEIKQRGGKTECSVRIAAGLPLAGFGREKKPFREYLLRSSQPVCFKFEGIAYKITIEDVKLFPQGYSAIALHSELIQNEPSVLLMDIGGWTVDLMRLDMHVHVDASKHTPQSLKNALSIMYSKEDILFKALNVNESRVERWCQKVREPMLEKIRKLPSNTTMDRLRREWYEGSDGSYEHYNWTRYYALNLHSVFYRGTLEWRCFESTLHAGKVRANITLALAISAQAINQSRTVMRKTEISENPAFTFRTFLLRLGLIGPEYKNVREHLLSKLPGDRAWRYDKAQYPSLQNRQNHER